MPTTATPTTESDHVEAVVAAAAGDRAAWDVLYRTHGEALRGYIRALDGADEVDDVFQTVWLQVVRDIGQLRDPATFPAWIRSIARHTTYRSTRRRRRQQATPRRAWVDDSIDELSNPEMILIDAEYADRARRALAELPVRSRDLLTARVIHEMSPADIAERSGLTTDTVHVGLTRGRKALRAAYDRLPLLLPPGVWRVVRYVQERGAIASDALVAVAALFLVLAAPPVQERPAPDRPTVTDVGQVEPVTGVSSPSRSAPIPTPPVAPPPTSTDRVGRSDDDLPVSTDSSSTSQDIVRLPGVGPSVRRYEGDFSDHPRPDVYVDDGAGNEARFWVFDYVGVERPDEAPHVDVAPGKTETPSIP